MRQDYSMIEMVKQLDSFRHRFKAAYDPTEGAPDLRWHATRLNIS